MIERVAWSALIADPVAVLGEIRAYPRRVIEVERSGSRPLRVRAYQPADHGERVTITDLKSRSREIGDRVALTGTEATEQGPVIVTRYGRAEVVIEVAP